MIHEIKGIIIVLIVLIVIIVVLNINYFLNNLLNLFYNLFKIDKKEHAHLSHNLNPFQNPQPTTE